MRINFQRQKFYALQSALHLLVFNLFLVMSGNGGTRWRSWLRHCWCHWKFSLK